MISLSRQSRLLLTVMMLVVSLFAGAAQAQQTIQFNVAVTGGTAPVKVTVYENPQAPAGTTVLAVHGFTETAKMWVPLKSAVFAHPVAKFLVKRFIALDLPGHGLSPLPLLTAPANFGALSLYDNVATVIQVIDGLRAQNLGPRVLIGHSMGGLAVQAVQEKLLSTGSSLAKKGVVKATLFAPVPVANITGWQPAAGGVPPQYFVTSPQYGTYILLDQQAALFGGGFSTRASTPTAPVITPAAFALDFTGQIGAEPQTTAGQLVGAIPGFPRPSARQGAFALKNGTLLTVVGFSQDILTPTEFQEPLYEHLLGRQGLLYQEVVAADAVHSMVISNPTGVLAQLWDFSSMF